MATATALTVAVLIERVRVMVGSVGVVGRVTTTTADGRPSRRTFLKLARWRSSPPAQTGGWPRGGWVRGGA